MIRCPSCAVESEPDARYCDGCGAELGVQAPAGPGEPRPARPEATPLVVYAPVRPRAWWYPIGVWVVLSAFFLFVDLVPGDGLGWAHGPIGVLGIFLVGFPLLHLLEAFVAGERPRLRGPRGEGSATADPEDARRRAGP
jgi:hypothetical protein